MMRLHTSAAVASLLFGYGCASAPATPSSSRPESVPARARTAERSDERAEPIEPDAARVQTTGLAPTLPQGITSFGMAATSDGALYVLGGFHGEPHHYVAEGQSSALWILRPGAERWEAGPALEAGLQSVALVPLEDGVHRVGGMRVGEPNELRSLTEHARFDLHSGAWIDAEPLPEPRSSHEAIAIGEDIYVVGGWALAGGPGSGRFATTMLRFRAGRWDSLESPVRRRAVGAAARGTTLVVAGGLTEEGTISQRVDVYSTATDRWSRAPDLPGERSGFGVALTATEAGFLASGMDGVLWRWSPGEAEWTRVGELRFPRFFHRMAATGDRVLVVGGIGGMHHHGRTRLVEVLSTVGERPALATVTLPWPGKAKNRQAMFVVGDHLYLFGGNDSLGQHDFGAEHFQQEGWRVHLPSLTIERRGDYPFRRQTMATRVAERDGELTVWVGGGFGHEPIDAGEPTEARTQAELYRYEVEADRFEPAPSLPEPRSQTDLVRGTDGSVFVIGGLDYDPTRDQEDRFRHLVGVSRLAPDGAAFESITAHLPGPRRAFAAASHGETHYLVGGMRDGFQLVDDCTRFDLRERTFAPFTCPERPRLSAELVAVGAHLALVGGTGPAGEEEGLAPIRQLERYDPESDEWEALGTELPFSPRHARAFAYRGGVLVVSTHDEGGRMRLALIDVAEAKRAD